MKLYRITFDEGFDPRYRQTREHARTYAQTAPVRDAVRIELIEIQPQAAEIVDMLNGAYEFAKTCSPIQTWGLTARGALRDVDNGE